MYIIFDTETGGIGLDKSLLTAYFHVCDKDFNFVDYLSLFLKPDDGIYRVTGEAIEINKINLASHDKIATPYKKAGTLLYHFLEKNYKLSKDKMIPVGHGMSGDLDHIWQSLVSRATWETFVSYRRLDTSVALQFLKSCGFFPENVSGSLESLCDYFNIDKGSLHTAEVDALNTKWVLKAMIEKAKRLRPITQYENGCD